MRRRSTLAVPLLVVLLWFSGCSSAVKSTKTEYKPHYRVDSVWDQLAVQDTSIQNLIESYKVQLHGEMSTVVSYTEETMIAGKPESKLSNLIADAMLEIGREYCRDRKMEHSVDFAVMNQGGIRTALPKGKITTGKVYEMLPFKNKLVIVAMKGKDVKVLLDQLAKSGGEAVSGIRMGIENQKAVQVELNGEALQPEQIYHVISVDYLVNSGGGMTAFAKRENFLHMHTKLRDEIIRYMAARYEKGMHLKSETDGRVYHVE